MEKNTSRQVRRANAIIKRNDGRIALIHRWDGEQEYIGLPTGYVYGDDQFDMAKEGTMDPRQKIEFMSTKKLMECTTVKKADEETMMVVCDMKVDPEKGIGDLEYQLIWMSEEEIQDKLMNCMWRGDHFYYGKDLSESAMYALLAYCFNEMYTLLAYQNASKK